MTRLDEGLAGLSRGRVVAKVAPLDAEAVGLDLEPIRTSGRATGNTPERVDTALLTLAMLGGNARAAAEELQAAGIEVKHATLNQWRTKLYPNRYRALAERHRSEVEERIVDTTRNIVDKSGEAALLAIQIGIQRMTDDPGSLRDPAGAARNYLTALGIATDKLLLLTDRPTQITEIRSADDVLAELDRRGFVTSTAVEIEPPADS